MSDTTPPAARTLADQRGLVADNLARAAAAHRFVNRRRRFEAGFSDRRRAAAERLFTVLSLVLLVALPNLAAVGYFNWMASDQYVSEARFILRPNKARLGGGGATAMAGATEIGRDTLVLADFLESAALVETLEADVGLRTRFEALPFAPAHLLDPPTPDRLAGLGPDRPAEDVLRFWKRMTDVSVQPGSGVVIFALRAFRPEDAHLLAQRSLVAAEALVNRMNARIWGDAVTMAQTLFAESAERLGRAEAALVAIRDELGIVAPDTASAALIGLIAQARGTLSRLEREYAARAGELDPQAALLRARAREIEAAREQLRALEAQLVGSGAGGGPATMAAALERFSTAEVEREAAQRSFLAAATQLERARLVAEAQTLYLDVFSPPALAEDATYPKRRWWLGGILAGTLALWGVARALFLLIRNHMA